MPTQHVSKEQLTASKLELLPADDFDALAAAGATYDGVPATTLGAMSCLQLIDSVYCTGDGEPTFRDMVVAAFVLCNGPEGMGPLFAANRAEAAVGRQYSTTATGERYALYLDALISTQSKYGDFEVKAHKWYDATVGAKAWIEVHRAVDESIADFYRALKRVQESAGGGQDDGDQDEKKTA